MMDNIFEGTNLDSYGFEPFVSTNPGEDLHLKSEADNCLKDGAKQLKPDNANTGFEIHQQPEFAPRIEDTFESLVLETADSNEDNCEMEVEESGITIDFETQYGDIDWVHDFEF